jgi:hypothetical protein
VIGFPNVLRELARSLASRLSARLRGVRRPSSQPGAVSLPQGRWARSQRRGPFAPSPALSRCQPSGGTSATSSSTRPKPSRCALVTAKPSLDPSAPPSRRRSRWERMIGRADHGDERNLLRDAGLGSPRPVRRPALGQMQRAVDQCPAVAAGVGQKHPDPAVLDPPCRAAVLPVNAGGVHPRPTSCPRRQPPAVLAPHGRQQTAPIGRGSTRPNRSPSRISSAANSADHAQPSSGVAMAPPPWRQP